MTTDTPRTDETISQIYDARWKEVPLDEFGEIRDLARELERELTAANAKVERYRVALQGLYDDQMDYIRLNHLSGAENNHFMFMAREALADNQKEQP